MSKRPCVSNVVTGLAQLGIEGVTEMQVSTLLDSALSEGRLRGITDPKELETFASERAYTKLATEKQAKRDSTVVAEENLVRRLQHALEAHPNDPKRALKSLLVGTLADRDSVGLAQETATRQALGEIFVELKKADVLEAFVHADKDLTLEIFSRKSNGVSKDALAIRSILEEMENRRLSRIQQAGLDADPLPNRLTRQHHDPHAIRRAGREKWVAFVRDILEEDIPAEDLNKMYDDFVVGRNNLIGDVVEEGPTPEVQVENPLTAERKLHFTPEGEVAYMLEFGAGSLAETVFTEISRHGKHLGLLQKLGPTPYATMRRMVQELRTEFPDNEALASYSRGFDAGQMGSRMGNDFSEVSGATSMVVGTRAHDISSNIQTFESMTKLGGATLAAVSDVGGMAQELNYQQGNPIGALTQAVGAVIEGIDSPTDQRAVVEAMGVGIESMLNEHSSRLGGTISPGAKRTKLLNLTFQLNLLTPWTNSVRRGLAIANSRYMAVVMRDIGDMHPRMKALIGSYGISDADLQLIAKEIDLVTPDSGPEMFSPAKIGLISPSKFGNGPAGLQRRIDLQRKFTSFFLDRNDFGVYTPDASVRSIVHQGLPKGAPLRVILDLFFQFKQYGIGMVYRPMANSLMGPGQTKAGGAMTLATHLAFLLPFGALSTHLKDAAKGREQFVPHTKEEYAKYFSTAMFQSGALGFYGEALQAGILENPTKAITRLAGPAANDALEYVEAGAEVLKGATGQKSDIGGATFEAFRNDIPLADLFYVKTPLDYGMMYGIAEALDPGFAHRYEKRVESQRMGRGLMFSPSNALGVR